MISTRYFKFINISLTISILQIKLPICHNSINSFIGSISISLTLLRFAFFIQIKCKRRDLFRKHILLIKKLFVLVIINNIFGSIIIYDPSDKKEINFNKMVNNSPFWSNENDFEIKLSQFIATKVVKHQFIKSEAIDLKEN